MRRWAGPDRTSPVRTHSGPHTAGTSEEVTDPSAKVQSEQRTTARALSGASPEGPRKPTRPTDQRKNADGCSRPVAGRPVGIVTPAPPLGEDVDDLLRPPRWSSLNDERDDQDDEDHRDGRAADDVQQRV